MKNLQNTDSRSPANYLPTVNVLDRFLGFLFGDDIFISYSHRDAINYAPALATALAGKKFVSYLDQYGGEVENELPARVIRHLKRSTAFVLVGTRSAVQSEAVRKEVEIFRATGRPIIPIDIGNALTQAEWIEIVKGIPVSRESESSSIASITLANEQIIAEPVLDDSENVEAPSLLVVSRVVDSFKYTKRNQRQRRMFLTAFILLVASLASTAIGVVRSWNATIDAAIAVDDRNKAQAQEQQANKDAKSAELRRVTAEAERGAALKDKNEAQANATAAVAREQVALRNEARASANARLQQTRASSLEKVSTSAQLIGTEPARALAVGVSAYQQYPSRETVGRLLDNLQRYHGLEKIQRNHMTSVSSVESPVNGLLVSVGEGISQSWETGTTSRRNNLIFWDGQTLKPIDVQSTDVSFDQSKISCLAGGNLCASNNEAQRIVLWTVDLTNKKITSHPTNIPFPDSSNGFELVSEKLLAVARTNGQIDLVNLDRPNSESRRLATGFYTKLNQIAVGTKKDKLALAYENGLALISLSEPQAFKPKSLLYSGEQRERFRNANSLSFSVNDELLAIGSWDLSSLIVKVSDLQPLGEPIEDSGGIVAFGRENNSNKLATANAKGISIWELSLPEAGRRRRLQIPVNDVRSLNFLPGSSQKLVTGLGDGTVALWDLARENTLARKFTDIEYDHVVDRFVFDETGEYLIGNSNVQTFETRIWRFADDKYTLVPNDEVPGLVARLRFPRRMGPSQKNSVWFDNRHNRGSEEFVLNLPGQNTYRSIAVLTNDDRTMVTIVGDDVVVWDVTNRQQARKIYKLPRGATPTSLALSHSEKILAVGDKGGEIVLFDLRSGRRIGSLTSPFSTQYMRGGVAAIAFSWDDSLIAFSHSPHTIDLWDRSSQTLIGSLDSRDFYSGVSLVFTPSGNGLLSCGYDGWRVWDISVASWLNRTLNIIGLKN